MDFKEVKIPEGDLIQYKDGVLVIGNNPIIGVLRGDGIGIDITPVMRKVVDSAVEKAYKGDRTISWCPLYAGLEGLHHYGSEFPDETVEAIRYLKVAIKGPFTTPIGMSRRTASLSMMRPSSLRNTARFSSNGTPSMGTPR